MPKSVMNLLPQGGETVRTGDVAKAATLNKTTVEVSEGTWEFKGWDNATLTVEEEDILFTGTWVFTAKEAPTATTPTTPTAPKTGDTANLYLYVGLLMAAAIATGAVSLARKK